MRVLIDTNVILDHLLDRKPFNKAAEWIFMQAERSQLEAFIGGTTVTTVHYLISKALGVKAGYTHIEKLLCIFEVAPVNRTVLTSALQLKFTDFDDAVLYEAAVAIGVGAIVTRDVKGFLKSAIPVYSSDEFVASF